mmetsp:Transcript_20001/g.53251  ORF Transcript_20001/g.53251 Transcript_20001/m.53251 type:complete len:302 (+) Transcript_20001:4684-5589(+)
MVQLQRKPFLENLAVDDPERNDELLAPNHPPRLAGNDVLAQVGVDNSLSRSDLGLRPDVVVSRQAQRAVSAHNILGLIQGHRRKHFRPPDDDVHSKVGRRHERSLQGQALQQLVVVRMETLALNGQGQLLARTRSSHSEVDEAALSPAPIGHHEPLLLEAATRVRLVGVKHKGSDFHARGSGVVVHDSDHNGVVADFFAGHFVFHVDHFVDDTADGPGKHLGLAHFPQGRDFDERIRGPGRVHCPQKPDLMDMYKHRPIPAREILLRNAGIRYHGHPLDARFTKQVARGVVLEPLLKERNA